ncbi:MAG TPA: PHP domain-containing protein [Gemmatimonadaceae bacterium]|nr:PHP domain-containing protein [Gemmatimonadaceae bacterium]
MSPPRAKTNLDTNAVVAGLLRDLSAAKSDRQSSLGYKRAAGAVFDLEEPLESYVEPGGALRKIANVGPKSERVALDVLRTGGSEYVETTVRASENADDVAQGRAVRENFMSRARVLEALAAPAPGAIEVSDYRGDLQMHSTWSDGRQTLEDIIEAALERGYAFCGVTDHSYGLRIARGVSMADLAEEHREIDALNQRYEGRFRLIKGIEANVMPDGSIDMKPDELARLEFVVAAPHSALRTPADQTARMVTAVRAHGVHILGHPRGRHYSERLGIQADWPEVFAAAANANVAVEVDGDPWRQDVDFELARDALAAGCLFALDSDAHSPPELRNAEIAVAHARLAGVPADRVINCWPFDRLMDWFADRR